MEQVAKNNKNTIVVVNSVGPINMEGWVTNPNITAIVRLGPGPAELCPTNVLVILGLERNSRTGSR